MESLLERELARKRGMQDLIGIAEPGRSGREADFDLRRTLLIRGVALGAVVKSEHELVIGAAPRLRCANRCKKPSADRVWPRQRGKKFSRKVLEGLANAPDAGLPGGSDIGEEAQNSRAGAAQSYRILL